MTDESLVIRAASDTCCAACVACRRITNETTGNTSSDAAEPQQAWSKKKDKNCIKSVTY